MTPMLAAVSAGKSASGKSKWSRQKRKMSALSASTRSQPSTAFGNSAFARRGRTTTPSVAASSAPKIFTIVTSPTERAPPIESRAWFSSGIV